MERRVTENDESSFWERKVIKNNGEFIFGISYVGSIPHDPLPTTEGFQKVLELLKKDIEQMSPLK